MNLIHLSNSKDILKIKQDFLKKVKYWIAIVGYSSPPEGYESIAVEVISKFIEKLLPDVGIVTSPTTDKGSIDVINTFISQRYNIPILYLTAVDYISSINPNILSKQIDKTKYIDTPKYIFTTVEKYCKATAIVSNILLIIGGSGTSTSDFVNAINNNNKVFIFNHKIFGSAIFNEKTYKPINASLYIINQIKSFLAYGKLQYPSYKKFTYKFLQKNKEMLEKLIEII